MPACGLLLKAVAALRRLPPGEQTDNTDASLKEDTPVIELESVGYSYGRGTPLLSDLTVKLAPGSFHFLTGPSGVGKTTFLKLCYLELRPTSGRVRVFGHSGSDLGRDHVALSRQKIGVVHQDCRFLDHLSVAENIALPLTVSRRPVPGTDLTELLAWVSLTDKASQKPPELSGGERQRAALARAVMTAPDVLLADEPTGNVDWEMSLRLLALMVELNRMGKTVLIATHDIALVRASRQYVQARVLRLQGGRLTLAGSDL